MRSCWTPAPGSPSPGTRDRRHDLRPRPRGGGRAYRLPRRGRDRETSVYSPPVLSWRAPAGVRPHAPPPGTFARWTPTMDLRRQVRCVRRGCGCCSPACCSRAAPPSSCASRCPRCTRAQVTLIVGQSLDNANPDYNQLLASQRLSQTYADLATTGPHPGQGHRREGLDTTPEDFRELVKADAPRDSTLVTVTVTDPDPVQAPRSRTPSPTRSSPSRPRSPARTRTCSSSSTAGPRRHPGADRGHPGGDPAPGGPPGPDAGATSTAPGAPVAGSSACARPMPPCWASAPAAARTCHHGRGSRHAAPEPASARGSCSTRCWPRSWASCSPSGSRSSWSTWTTPLKSPEDVEAVTGLPTLGTIIKMKGEKGRSVIYQLATILYPRSPAAEAYRTLRTNIEFASRGRAGQDDPRDHSRSRARARPPPPPTSPRPSPRRAARRSCWTRTCASPASTRSSSCPTRRASPPAPPATRSRSTTSRSPRSRRTCGCITTGPLPPNPAELLRSPSGCARVLERLAASADLVIVDSPPLQAVTDAAILSSIMDGTLLVIDSGRTRRGARPSTAARPWPRRAPGSWAWRSTGCRSPCPGTSTYYYDYYGG